MQREPGAVVDARDSRRRPGTPPAPRRPVPPGDRRAAGAPAARPRLGAGPVWPSRAPTGRQRSASRRIGRSAMLATTTSAAGSGNEGSVASPTRNVGARSFIAALPAAAWTATGSMSIPQTGANPSRRAAKETTPEPEPRSSSEPVGIAWMSSRHWRVLACPPVPKARPASTTMSRRSSRGGYQGGRTQSRPITCGLWNRRQASSQPGRSRETSRRPSAPIRLSAAPTATSASAPSSSQNTRARPSSSSCHPAGCNAMISWTTAGAR